MIPEPAKAHYGTMMRGTFVGVEARWGSSLRPCDGKIPGVSGVILAGGENRRMGCDKSFLPIGGTRFIERIYGRLADLFDEVIVVTNTPERYRELSCRTVPDRYPVRCSLVGLHSALFHSVSSKVFVVACDMPFISGEVIRRLCAQRHGNEVVVPCDDRGMETLHALYDRSCIPAIERVLEKGGKEIREFFDSVQVRKVAMTSFTDCDPDGCSFRNINTPLEYARFTRGM